MLLLISPMHQNRDKSSQKNCKPKIRKRVTQDNHVIFFYLAPHVNVQYLRTILTAKHRDVNVDNPPQYKTIQTSIMLYYGSMSTILQQNLADNIIENAKRSKKRNKKELLVSSGYSIETATASPNVILEAKGVKEELEIRGFTVENAKRVVKEIMLDEDNFPRDRIAAAKEVFAVEGAYAPTKSVNFSVDVNELQKTITEQIKSFRGLIEPMNTE